MSRLDDHELDPEIEACLDAIDATLAGEPVDPQHAEFAELALLLRDDRPRPAPGFASELDAKVARRFAAPRAGGPGGQPGVWRRPRKLLWSTMTAGGFAAAAVIAVVAIGSLGHGTSSLSSSSASVPAHASVSSSASRRASSGAASRTPSTPNLAAAASSATAPQTVTPSPNGRKVIQSAELDLAAAPNRIDAVAQQVFSVVGAANGIVDTSKVTQTGGLDGSAYFSLRLPSANLGQTLARLSNLNGARVVSRSDDSHDVNSQYLSTQRALSDAQALRASLLHQLAAAVSPAEIDSLQAQIHDVDGKISSDQAALRGLNSQVDYSRVTVTIDAQSTPPPAKHSSGGGGFTLHHAAHIAGRVLVVAAGVALIALAGLLPVALLIAAIAWIRLALVRRRREQALELA